MTTTHCPFGRTVLDGHDAAERFECPSCGLTRKPLVELRGPRGQPKRTVVVFPTHYPLAAPRQQDSAPAVPSPRSNGDRRRRAARPSRPAFVRGDRVLVAEPSRVDWEGEVLSVKPSGDSWRVEVRGDDHVAWVVPSHMVEEVTHV